MTKLIEYGPAKIVSIDEKTAHEIELAGYKWKAILGLQRNPLIINRLRKNTYKVEAKGVAGFISFNQVGFEIIPKFLSEDEIGAEWKISMWNFFLYGSGLTIFGKSNSSIESFDGIVDLLAYAFINEFKKSYVRGFPFEYQSVRLSSSSIKGRLDSKRFFKLLPVTGKVDQIQNRLSQNTNVASLLKWSCLQMMNNVSSGQLRQQLSDISSQIPSESNRKPNYLDVFTAKRSCPHLSSLIDIAMVIFDDKTLNFGNSEMKLPGFLWNSHSLFEKVVFRLFKESFQPEDITIEKSAQRLLQPNNGRYPVNTIPDLRLVKNGETNYLIDAKYKILKNQPKTEDVYQVLAGGRINRIREVCLIYPGNGVDNTHKEYDVMTDSHPSKVLTYKLDLSMFSSLKNLNELKRKVSLVF
ncbi:hypothetical protein KUL42_22690 [Alteromonas sp. KUL42]|uniref:5-methylcytosine restriction system specificity protein McrC n=1 Tax=Alteromonas sp. KUL42 TaxID=2480797 RepID=UPI001036AEED|nr:hypothetical protein [Alteromonas sp. KUL42]TAP34764.1 hypothetical protein EYR97_11185 [Alteromonas sp. KUL42]GEA07508.1 hypothetical protein KUL42_22690 [Alteromonas sp. KUL42]